MHTPEQAKSLWCPMARVAQVGAIETTATYNRALAKVHVPIALKVDEQGQADDPETKPFQATMLKTEVQLSSAAMCVGDQCAMWRWVPKHKLVTFDQAYGTPPVLVGNVQLSRVRTDSTHGYCGLAPVHGVAA